MHYPHLWDDAKIDPAELDRLVGDKWEKGKMIAWHRNYLHTSDNFKNTGMKKKLALVIFLNKDD